MGELLRLLGLVKGIRQEVHLKREIEALGVPHAEAKIPPGARFAGVEKPEGIRIAGPAGAVVIIIE